MITICHLYPELLNLYGDRGNVTALVRRCSWRGLEVRVEEMGLGEAFDPRGADIVFMGGGSDREQALMSSDMPRLRDGLERAVDDGVVVLAVCGGYQMLGRSYLDAAGREIAGLGILDIHTEAGDRRLRGNIAVEVSLGGRVEVVTGFENHGGRTVLGSVQRLGRVLSGHGNNGRDGGEGARRRNLLATYLHGPVLPRNPWLADHMIGLALERKGQSPRLAPLDDSLEIEARARMLRRLRVRR